MNPAKSAVKLAKSLVKPSIAAAGACLAGELVHFVAHGSDYGVPATVVGSNQLILVLGCPSNLDGSPHPMQVWRTKIAIRTVDPDSASTTILFSGRGTHAKVSEAAEMADIARQFGVDDSMIALEEYSKSTWQNIEFSMEYIERADVVQIVSTPLHARRARWYLARQRPELTQKLAPAADYRFGEHPLMKLTSAFYETVGAFREWRRPRLPDMSVHN